MEKFRLVKQEIVNKKVQLEQRKAQLMPTYENTSVELAKIDEELTNLNGQLEMIESVTQQEQPQE